MELLLLKKVINPQYLFIMRLLIRIAAVFLTFLALREAVRLSAGGLTDDAAVAYGTLLPPEVSLNYFTMILLLLVFVTFGVYWLLSTFLLRAYQYYLSQKSATRQTA